MRELDDVSVKENRCLISPALVIRIHLHSGTSVDDDMPSPSHSGSDEPGDKNAYNHNVHISINRRIQMPPAFHFPEDQAPPSDLMGATGQQQQDFSKVEYF